MYKKNLQLQLLVDKNPLHTTLALLNNCAEKAGFIEGSPLFTKKMKSQLEGNRKIIVESYEDVKKLIVILDKLIKKRTRR